VKARYPSADNVGDSRMVFNIGGNKYRLVVHFNYEIQIADIKFIGTHREYDKIDVETVR
jgi:mRNA interferase HigB